MSHTHTRAHLATALRAHLAARVTALALEARDPGVRTGFMDPTNPSTWIQYSTPTAFMEGHTTAPPVQRDAVGMGTGAGKTAWRGLLMRGAPRPDTDTDSHSVDADDEGANE